MPVIDRGTWSSELDNVDVTDRNGTCRALAEISQMTRSCSGRLDVAVPSVANRSRELDNVDVTDRIGTENARPGRPTP